MDFTILISNYTTGLANSFGGLAGNSRNPSNDQYDAFRHALVSAELARAGEGFSEFWMSRHEDEVPNDPPVDNMDRWNNKVGRDEYENWREAWTTGQTTDSLAKWIYDKVLEGKTINTPLDPRKYNDLPSPGDKNHNGIPDIHESIDPAAKAANDAAKTGFPATTRSPST